MFEFRVCLAFQAFSGHGMAPYPGVARGFSFSFPGMLQAPRYPATDMPIKSTLHGLRRTDRARVMFHALASILRIKQDGASPAATSFLVGLYFRGDESAVTKTFNGGASIFSEPGMTTRLQYGPEEGGSISCVWRKGVRHGLASAVAGRGLLLAAVPPSRARPPLCPHSRAEGPYARRLAALAAGLPPSGEGDRRTLSDDDVQGGLKAPPTFTL